MWLAERIKETTEVEVLRKVKTWHLAIGALVGMGLSAAMAWNGGVLKLYNDIPSLVGYGLMLLFIYRLNIWWINRFFEHTSKIGYEWYLIHSLTFIIVHHYLDEDLPMWVILMICLMVSYVGAYMYNKMIFFVLGMKSRYSSDEHN